MEYQDMENEAFRWKLKRKRKNRTRKRDSGSEGGEKD